MVQTLAFHISLVLIRWHLHRPSAVRPALIRGSAMTDAPVLDPSKPDSFWRPQCVDVWISSAHTKVHCRVSSGVSVHRLAVTIGAARVDHLSRLIDIRARNPDRLLAHPFGTDQLGREYLARI